MITTEKLTLQQFLDAPKGHFICELIEGEAITKMSPKRFHSRLAITFCILLKNWCKNNGEVGLEWSVTLKRNGKDWIPVPDLLYISNDRLPPERFEDEACPFPPELVIEIISPGQSFGDLAEKATDYLKAGVNRVWLVDSKAKSITVFYPDQPPQTKRNNDSLNNDYLPDFNITVGDIFREAGLS